MTVFWITVLRRIRESEHGESQPALFRTILEAFVNAASKVERQRDHFRAYEAWAAADEEAQAVRSASLMTAARRWDG
jgi:hypothetical protein